jgi:hypothetical protein
MVSHTSSFQILIANKLHTNSKRPCSQQPAQCSRQDNVTIVSPDLTKESLLDISLSRPDVKAGPWRQTSHQLYLTRVRLKSLMVLFCV